MTHRSPPRPAPALQNTTAQAPHQSLHVKKCRHQLQELGGLRPLHPQDRAAS